MYFLHRSDFHLQNNYITAIYLFSPLDLVPSNTSTTQTYPVGSDHLTLSLSHYSDREINQRVLHFLMTLSSRLN